MQQVVCSDDGCHMVPVSKWNWPVQQGCCSQSFRRLDRIRIALTRGVITDITYCITVASFSLVQTDGLVPVMTAYEMVAFCTALLLPHLNKEQQRVRAETVLDMLGLAEQHNTLVSCR